jgi:hypothetical protein
MPFGIVGHRFATAFLQRQTRLYAIQRLNLTFLLNRNRDCWLWWVEIQPDYVFQFLDELRMAADLEGFQQVRVLVRAPAKRVVHWPR